MNEDLKNALNKMGMSSCPTASEWSIDLLLKVAPDSISNLDEFTLTESESKAFNDYVETRRKK